MRVALLCRVYLHGVGIGVTYVGIAIVPVFRARFRFRYGNDRHTCLSNDSIHVYCIVHAHEYTLRFCEHATKGM